MDTLKGFMDKFRVGREEPFTHVSQRTPNMKSGRYYIPNEKKKVFFIYYENALKNGNFLNIAEKPGNYGPLRVDFDFSSDLDIGLTRQYNENMLKTIVSYYQEEIRSIVDEDEFDKSMLWCIVLEKENPRSEEGKIKDGFHLHFPYFICDGKIQDNYLRERVNSKMVNNKSLWSHSNINEKVEDIIDPKIANKPWMMYGSLNYKSKYSTAYTYQRRQTEIDENVKDPWKDIVKQWGHVFDHNLKEIPMYYVFEDEMKNRKNSIRYYLPELLSIQGYQKSVKLVEEVKNKINTINKNQNSNKRKLGTNRTKSKEEILKDIKEIKDGQIMEMISDERADSYNEWMDVGWTLFNVGQGCEEALQMWIDFSRRSGKFVEGECERLWNKMECRDKTKASLYAMAKNDNPEMYKELKDTHIRKWLHQSTYEKDPKEWDIAMVVYAMYSDRFVCADAKKDVWYEFYNHKWHIMHDNLGLKGKLVKDVISKYLEFHKELANQMAEAHSEGNETERKNIEEKQKRVLNIVSKLKTTNFHDKIIKMCKLEMHDPSFMDKRDENRTIVGCENGVYDFNLGTLRDGRPDDYCTFSTKLNYEEYEEDDEEVEELNLFLKKLFPNSNIRQFFLDSCSVALRGGNVNKRFNVCTGDGDNGKSISFDLLELVFGDYFGNFPRELLLRGGGNSSASARPEIARTKGKRFMSIQEISDHDNLDKGVLKELTGGDSMFARGIYEQGTEIKPNYTLFMQCNTPPWIPGHDEATWSRLRIIDYESKFVKPNDLKKYPVPEDDEEQFEEKRFEADLYLEDKLEYLAPVMLWKLLKNYERCKNGIEEPREVKDSTRNYRLENDIYLQFIKECLMMVEDKEEAKNTYVRASELNQEFQQWYKDNYPSYAQKDKVGLHHLKKEMNKRLGIVRNKEDIYGFVDKRPVGWRGYKIVQEDGEVSKIQGLMKKG